MSVGTHRLRTLGVLLAVVVVGTSLVACGKDKKDAPKPPPTTTEVRDGEAATVASPDQKVTVRLPAGAASGEGQLSVREATDPSGQPGWVIDLTGATLTGEAELRFTRPTQDHGEPGPLVYWAPEPGAVPTLAPSTVDGDEVVVRTKHFSFWFLPDWKGIAKSTLSWAGTKLDSLFSLGAQGKQPKCSEESGVRSSGYQVTSDQGKRVYWCLGREKGQAVLKAVNARGYGVAVEYTPGFTVRSLDVADLVGQIAQLFPTVPTRRGNKVLLLPSADQVVFNAPRSGQAAVRFTPDGAAYTLSALAFAVETVDLLGGKLGSKGLGGKIVNGLKEGAQCLNTLTEIMTNDLDTATDAIKFFKAAIDASFDCVGDVVEEIDLGPINNLIVAPLLWLIDGVYTAVNGVVAAVEAFDLTGYQILVTAPAVSGPATEKVVINPFTDTGLKPGWSLDDRWEGSLTVSCRYDTGSPYALGPGTHDCGTTADSANACWWSPARTDQLWCLNSMELNDKKLTVRDATDVRVTPAPKNPYPLFLELSDGSTWRARTGGAWGSRADGYEPTYACTNNKGVCAKGWNVLSKGTASVDTSSSTWTVYVGPTGEPQDRFPPPTEMAVRRAYFIAGKLWHGH